MDAEAAPVQVQDDAALGALRRCIHRAPSSSVKGMTVPASPSAPPKCRSKLNARARSNSTESDRRQIGLTSARNNTLIIARRILASREAAAARA